MKSLLLPLNLRSEYRNVLDYGISFALKSNGVLDILYADGSLLKFGKWVFESGEDEAVKAAFIQRFKEADKSKVVSVIRLLESKKINFRFILLHTSAINGIVQQIKAIDYDLMIMGTRDKANTGIIRGPFVNQVLAKIKTPSLIIPETLPFNEIQHITYAADLADYDDDILSGLINMARLFDAKLMLIHVNDSDKASDHYLSVLEKTVDITLRYPKILYNFLDNTDIFTGIEKLVEVSNTNLVAMINRNSVHAKNNLTRRAVRDLGVPLLAYQKN